MLKKAMVFTLAASMLVATPLTASAAGIRGVYSISDGINENESGTGTVTNTDTGSGVLNANDAKIMGIVLDKETVNAVKGKKETLKATVIVDGEFASAAEKEDVLNKLSKKIKWELSNADGSKDTNPAATVGISSSVADRTVVELNPKKGTPKGMAIRVTAKIDGSYYFVKDEDGNVVVKEYTNKVGTYTAYADVTVKEYSTALKLEGMPTPYLKHTVDLNEYLVRTPVTANDDITWISTDTKIATVTAAGVVTYKKVGDGSIIAVGEQGAKYTWDFTVEAGEQSSKIEIVDDQGKTFPGKKINDVDLRDDDWTIDVDVRMYKTMKVAVGADGKTPAQTVAQADEGKNNKDKYTVKNVAVADGDTYVVVEKVDGVEVAKEVGPLDITDTVTWRSNKPAIVSVDAKPGESGAVLTANGVGKAVITAKASSGKSDKLTVTVKATLKGLDIAVGVDDDEYVLGTMDSYSGKSYQLYARKDPEQSKDAVKWSIAKVVKLNDDLTPVTKNGKDVMIANPNATINQKGVLTIKPKLDLKYPDITVELKSSKELETGEINAETNKPVKKAVVAEPLIVSVEQSSLEAIRVKDDANKLIADVSVIDGKVKVNDKSVIPNKQDNTTEISVPKNRTYTATVKVTEGYENDGNGLDTLTWTTSNAKIASVDPAEDGTAKITANANGTATITVSGVRVTTNPKNGNVSASAIKTTFKVSVKQPVTTVTLNKPSVVLNEKVNNKKVTQNQKVALKATLGPKGVGKKEAVHWSVKQTAGVDHSTALADLKTLGLQNKNGAEITTANISVTLPTPTVGDVFEITARTDSGASATSTVKIVSKTTGVAIAEEAELKDGQPVLFTTQNKAGKDVANTKNATIGETFKMNPFINISSNKQSPDWKAAGAKVAADDVREDVTYSVNKKGIVNIDSDGTVHVINSGTVTITAKTPLNKKATLKVTVAKP